MKYKLMHFGLLCLDMQKSLKVYQEQLNNELTTRIDMPGEVDITFLGRGNDATLELVAPPFLDYEDKHLAHHGHSINHISFEVEDADLAYEELKNKGVKIAWKPKDLEIMRQCGFYDTDGLIVEVYSYTGTESLAAPDYVKSPKPAGLTLHHISILTHDMIASERFYIEKLGMRRVAEYFNEGGEGGFVFLVDPLYDGKEHGFMLEIIGPPGLEEREEALLKKRGPLFDHICYTANDVSGAWQAAMDNGAQNFIKPYEEYGSEIAWIRDADGNDIEFMSPFSKELVDHIVNRKESIVLSI